MKMMMKQSEIAIFLQHDLHYNKYWHQRRVSKYVTQYDETISLMKNYSYIFVYVHCDEYDMKSFQNKYLWLLGGQLHIQCERYITLFITCYKKKFCYCGKKAIYYCSEDNCNNFICKKCFNEYNSNNINFMAPNNNVNSNDSKEEEDDDDISNQSSVHSEINEDQNINADQV